MLTATRSIICGLIFGGPLATVGFLLLMSVLSKDIHGVYAQGQVGQECRSVDRKRAFICLFLGLGIMLLSMIPLILL